MCSAPGAALNTTIYGAARMRLKRGVGLTLRVPICKAQAGDRSVRNESTSVLPVGRGTGDSYVVCVPSESDCVTDAKCIEL